jgi:lipoprotein-anchoring transpeptidase ErfK/SrfK
MRNVAAFGFLALTCGTTAASAQGYGCGFIEPLMTGRDPTPYVRPARPFAGQAPDVYGRTRVAALPGAPLRDEVGVGRIIDPKYRRQTVSYDGPHAAGAIVIDTPSKFLYLVEAGGKALRYGIGVGRPGFEWAG